MITINGRTVYFRKNIILQLNKYDSLGIQKVGDDLGNSLMILLNGKGGWRVSRVNPKDPPFVIKRKILGVALEVISMFPNDYLHISKGR